MKKQANFVFVVLGLVAGAGCSQVQDRASQGSAEFVSTSELRTLPPGEYQGLLSMSSENLRDLAERGSLGNCRVQRVSVPTDRCQGQMAYALRLERENVFYPTMSRNHQIAGGSTAHTATACSDRINDYVTGALRSGFCFANRVRPEELTGPEALALAVAGRLGRCRVELTTDAATCSANPGNAAYQVSAPRMAPATACSPLEATEFLATLVSNSGCEN